MSLLVKKASPVPLVVSEHLSLTRIMVELGLAPRAPLHLNETADLIPVISGCPGQTSVYQCDSRGHLTHVTLRFDAARAAPRSRRTSGRTSIWEQTTGSLFNGLKGAALAVAVRGYHGGWAFDGIRVSNLSIFDSQLHNAAPNASLFEYGVAAALTLHNCSLIGFRLPPAPHSDLRFCHFVNVSLPCPVPLWIESFCGLRNANASCFLPPALPPATLSLLPSPSLVLVPRDSDLLATDGVLATDDYTHCFASPMDCSAYGVPPPLLIAERGFELVCLRACQLYNCTPSGRVGGDRNVPEGETGYPCRAILGQLCTFSSLGQCSAYYYRPGNATTNATLDVGFQTMLYTVGVSIGEPFGIGLVTRVELWNTTSAEFVVAFDRSRAERRVRQVGVAYEALFVREPMLTSRVRLHFESILLSDVIGAIVLIGALQPLDAYVPPPECPAPFTLDADSMLDETRGDSLCINALCQEPCVQDSGGNSSVTTFGVVVSPPVFVVVDGGAVLVEPADATLMNSTASANTRIYALPANASQSLKLAGDVSRVRLVGQSTLDNTLPPTLPSSLAPRVPGMFVKRRIAAATVAASSADGCPVQLISPRIGATCVWSTKRAIFVGGSGDGAPSARIDVFDLVANRWAAPMTAPFASSNASAALYRDATLFVMTTNATLQRFDLESGYWSTPNWQLSELALNDGQAAPQRKLMVVGDALLVVIAAFVQPFHDGLRRPLLAGRRVVDTPLDVIVVARDIVYKSLMTHDFDKDIAALNVLQASNGSFAIARRDGDGAAIQFEWRPLAYEPQECTDRIACDSCINDFRNVEPCRWCSSLGQCLARTSSCTPSLLDASMCPTTTTTITSTVATTSSSFLSGSDSILTSSSATAVPTGSSDLIAMTSSSSSDVGLIVGLIIAAIFVMAMIGILIWWISRRTKEQGQQAAVGQQQKQLHQQQVGQERLNSRNEIEMSAQSANTAAWYDAAPAVGGESDSIAYRAVARGSEVAGYHMDEDDDDESE